jgi:hypothetical protein
VVLPTLALERLTFCGWWKKKSKVK